MNHNPDLRKDILKVFKQYEHQNRSTIDTGRIRRTLGRGTNVVRAELQRMEVDGLVRRYAPYSAINNTFWERVGGPTG